MPIDSSRDFLHSSSFGEHEPYFFPLADVFRLDKRAWHLRYGDADDHVVELQTLLLQLVLDVDVTASAALWRPAVYCGGRVKRHGHTSQYSSKTVVSVICRSAILYFKPSVNTNVSMSNGKHFHWSRDEREKHSRLTRVDTYWLEVWGTRLWSVVSTWGRQHHCWGGRTSPGSSGRSPTRPWTTSCPHWDVSDETNNQCKLQLIIRTWRTLKTSPEEDLMLVI